MQVTRGHWKKETTTGTFYGHLRHEAQCLEQNVNSLLCLGDEQKKMNIPVQRIREVTELRWQKNMSDNKELPIR